VDTLDGRRLRALAVPSRRRLLERIEQAPARPGGRTVTELAGATALHPNTVRLHLNVLADAGLVVSVAADVTGAVPSEASGRVDGPLRGRPPVRYQVVANDVGAAEAGSAGTGALVTLATWIATGIDPATARATGDRIGRALPPPAGARHGLGAVVGLLADEGFEPRLAAGAGDGRDTVVLARCPFAGVGPALLGTVCELHRGVLDGVAANAGTTAELVVGDPAHGGCRVTLGRDGTEPAGP
jgi:predicted ArsR family transcriptional regulator